MPDYSTLSSQISLYKSAAANLMTTSTLTANDLALVGASLNTLGTDLGTNDIYTATQNQIVAINAATTSAIATINASANGSALATAQSNITTLQNQMSNVNSFISTNASQYSTINSQLTSIQSSVATVPSAWSVKTANYTAVNGDRLLITPAAGLVITLPLNPGVGYQVQVVDMAGTSATTNFTLARNGSLIQGASSDLIFNVNGYALTLVYSGSTYGWRKV